jgi:hypothetical protein
VRPGSAQALRDHPPDPGLGVTSGDRLSADLAAVGTSRYRQLVRDVLAEGGATGELDLEPVGLTADTAAGLLIAAARGLEPSPDKLPAYRRSLSTLARVMIARLSSRLPTDRVSPPTA